MHERMLRVLLVDHESYLCASLSTFLQIENGYHVDTAGSVDEGRTQIDAAHGQYDVVLINDLLLPATGHDPEPLGIQLMSELHARYPEIQWIVFTSLGVESGLAALRAGAYRYLPKPLHPEELAILIDHAAEYQRLRASEQRAAQQAAQRARDIEAIQRVTTALSSLQNVDQIPEATCQAAVELFGVEHSGLMLLNHNGSHGEVIAEYPELGTRGVTIPVAGITAEEELIRSKQPLVVENVDHEATLGSVQAILKRFDIRSILFVPVVYKDRVLGSFSLDSIGRSCSFTDYHIELCTIFATQVAAAIENRNVYRRLETEADRMKVLYEISHEMTSTLDLEQLLDSIAAQVVRLIKARQSLFLFINRPARRVIKASGWGYSEEHLRSITFEEVESGISGWVLHTREAMLVPDSLADAHNTGIAQERAREFNSGALLVAPLLVRDDIIGTLTAVNQADDPPFSEDDLRLVVMLANQAAIAIEKTRLYQETERRRQLLEALDEASRHIRGEKETARLLPEIVRLAAELLHCDIAALCVHRSGLQELEVRVTYGLPDTLIGSYVTGEDGLIMATAQTGVTQCNNNYLASAAPESFFAEYDKLSLVVVPLKWGGELGAVLFVGDTSGTREFSAADQEILERFAGQAALVLQTSQIMSQEQRTLSHLAILHKISDYIQAARDLDKILHVTLTGVTAGYGLGFNRAALLLLNEQQDTLVGHMGIGYLDGEQVHKEWKLHTSLGLEYFGTYLKLLESNQLSATPIGDNIRGLRLPLDPTGNMVLARVILTKRPIELTHHELHELPQAFIAAFEPALPGVVVPLTARNDVIGLLVADNKFTGAPITHDTIDALLTFTNTAAIAVNNTRLFKQVEASEARHRALHEASTTLISPQEPRKVLQDIVEQACNAAHAQWVSVLLIDKSGKVRDLITAGINKQFVMEDVIRPNGISIQVMTTHRAVPIEDTYKHREHVSANMFRYNIAAALCLPLLLQGNAIGVMWLHYDQPHYFPQAEIDAIQLYVNQAAIAYDNARRLTELGHMRHAAEALAGAGDLQEVLRRIVESAQAVLQADSAILWSYAEIPNRLVSTKSVTAAHVAALHQEQSRKTGPRPNGTSDTIMERGWIGVDDVNDRHRYPFLGDLTHAFLRQIKAQSFQGIGLKVGDEKLGVLYVNYERPRSFSEEEREIAQSFANHAAQVLKRAKLLARLDKTRNAARVVAEVTVLEENLKRTLDSVVQGMQDVLHCDAITIYEYDLNKQMFGYPPTMLGVKYPERASRLVKEPRDSLVFKVLNLDTIYVADKILDDPLFKGSRFTDDEKIASCAAIPLKVGTDRVGAMFVNYRTLHHFIQDELINIELLANQAAVAIRNAHLYQERQRRINTLLALYKAGQAVTGSLTIEETLKQIVEQALMLVGESTNGCLSHLTMAEGHLLRSTAAYPPERLADIQAKLGTIDLRNSSKIGVTGRTILRGETQLVPDVSKDPDYLAYDAAIRSQLGVPIKDGAVTIGAINMEHTERDAFSIEDGQALEALAGYAAVAIKNARLFTEVQTRLDELRQTQEMLAARTALAWMGMVSSQWRHAIEGHAITIADEVELLRSILTDAASSDGIGAKLTKIERLAKMILDKPITPPLSSEEGVTSVPINALLNERLGQLWKEDPYRFTIPIFLPSNDKRLTVRASSEWLRRAFDTLIDNAVEAVNKSPTKHITIATQSHDGWVMISISDTGGGIPPHIRPYLFQKPIPKAKGEKGLGMGLLMAHTIVQTYGGEVKVEDTGSTGTTMVIKLPVEQ